MNHLFARGCLFSLLFTCLIQCQLAAETDNINSNTNGMEEHGVVPDVIDKTPKNVLKVSYQAGKLPIDLGTVMTPTQVKDTPQVEWDATSEKHYLLAMVDPDAPSRADPKVREVLHWLVGNIPGKDLSKGEVLTAYAGSGPPQGTGLHRYIFLVYEQPDKLQFDEPRVKNTSREGRLHFSIRKFAAKYKLGDAIAGNFYRAEYDDYVPILHKQLSGGN